MYEEYSDSPQYTIVKRTVDECKAQLFNDYGPNYYPVKITPIIKEGFLGFGKKEMVEMKYVLRNRNSTPKKAPVDDFEKSKEEILKKLSPSLDTAKQLVAIDKKIEELTALFTNKIDDIKTSADAPHANILRIAEVMEENEFSKEYIKDITDKIKAEFSLEEIEDYEKVEAQVVDWIGESISISKKKPHRPPHVIVIVGPTGVGKTTTIAKIAAQQIIGADKEGLQRPEIRLISADITRVAAEEQLRHYGDAMEIQVDKAENAEDIKTIFRQCKDSTDVILVDTSGYSPNDSESIARLKNKLSVDGLRPDVYLAVTASTKVKDLRNIIQNYEPFAFNSMIITKCDETSQYGNIISVLAEKHKSISFVTFGQAVAKNISRPTVVEFLIRLTGFKINRTHIEDKFGE